MCLSRMYLTRCHETAAFCSWLLISSINSLFSIHPPLSSPLLPSPPPLLPTATRPCPRRPPWLRGYLLLWQPLARGGGGASRAVSERAPRCGSSWEEGIDNGERGGRPPQKRGEGRQHFFPPHCIMGKVIQSPVIKCLIIQH